MESLEYQAVRSDLIIDFASATSSQPRGLRFASTLRQGSVTLAQCFFRPNDGAHIGASQVTVGIYDGAAFEMNWRSPDSDRLQSGSMSKGQAHVGDGRLPLWVRCNTAPSFFAFAMDDAFVAETCEGISDGLTDYALKTSIGVEDPVIARIGALGQLELAQGGDGGRLYVESLGTALAAHLLRSIDSRPSLLVRISAEIRAELTVVMLHLAMLRGSDLASISLRDTWRREAASHLRTSESEEPDVRSDASCIELDDDFAIAEPIDVCITLSEQTQLWALFWAARCQNRT